MKQKLLITFCLTAMIQFSYAQCMLIPSPLEERAKNSQTIVEGKVLSQQSFWNNQHDGIYTVNQVEVYKVFKGDISSSAIEIVTEGGRVDNIIQHFTSTLSLEIGQTGIFTLNPIHYNLDNYTLKNSYDVYTSMQGFIKYNMEEKNAKDVFYTYNNIDNELYPALAKLTNQSFSELKKLEFPQNNISGSRMAPVITDFSPATVTAGTKTQLTINGTGFGSAQGASNYVEFRNCDDGGSTFIQPLASEYVSWSDNKIVVNVPSKAGTGTFRVRNSTSTTSPSSLSVSFTNMNAQYTNSGSLQAYMTDHVSDNGAGGYSWEMNVNFDGNASAKEAFLRAVQNWRCSAFVNWQISTTSSIDTVGNGGDGTNVIIFENVSKPLPSGVLGRCTSWWSGCGFGGNINVWYVTELDIQFDNSANWYYGTGTPTSSQYDFESVALHELGHGMQLGHVVNSLDIMHYSLGTGESKKVLNTDDIAGANLVMSRSVVTNTCGGTIKMTALTSSNCGGLVNNNDEFISSEENFIVYPNPAGNSLNMSIDFVSVKDFSIEIINILGEIIFSKKISASAQFQNSLDVSVFSNGVYVVKVNDGEKIMTRKIIIAK